MAALADGQLDVLGAQATIMHHRRWEKLFCGAMSIFLDTAGGWSYLLIIRRQ